jgi:hypothetical protein
MFEMHFNEERRYSDRQAFEEIMPQHMFAHACPLRLTSGQAKVEDPAQTGVRLDALAGA